MKFRHLEPSEIECRVATIKKNGLSLLLYKDARCDMGVLDEFPGAPFWRRDHKEVKGNVYCGVSLYLNLGTNDNPDMQWITKWDAGAESYTEKVKGEASDSFKRACFNWGIGRELYTAPFIWIKPYDANEFKESNGKYKTYSKFSVQDIEYTDDVISYLEIVDQNGIVRYTYGNAAQSTDEQWRTINSFNLSEDKRTKWEKYFKVGALQTITKKQASFMIEKLQVTK